MKPDVPDATFSGSQSLLTEPLIKNGFCCAAVVNTGGNEVTLLDAPVEVPLYQVIPPSLLVSP